MKDLIDGANDKSEISVHYARKLFRNEELYNEWLEFEGQLIESPKRGPFLDALTSFAEIYAGINSESKIKELETIMNIYMKEPNKHALDQRVKVLAYCTSDSSDRIPFLLNDNFDTEKITDWQKKPKDYKPYNYVLIDWEFKAMPWPYIVSNAQPGTKFILFNVPNNTSDRNIFDYMVSVLLRRDETTDTSLEKIICDYLSFGLKQRYFKEKIKYLNLCYSHNIEPMKISYKICTDYCKRYKIDTLDLFEAEYYLAIGELEKSKRHAEKYFGTYGESPWVLELLGRIYIQLGENEKAIPIFERVIFQNPDDVNILCRISDKYAEIGDRKSSDKYIDKANAMEPESIAVIESNLKSKVIFGESEGAKSLISKLPSLNRVVSYLNNLAISYAAVGDFAKSVELYNDAINVVGAHDEHIKHIVSYNLAICYLRARDYESALYYLVLHYLLIFLAIRESA